MKILFWALLLTVTSGLGDILAKKHMPLLSFAFYGITSVAWIWLLGSKGFPLTKTIALYAVASYLFVGAAGPLLFNESLSVYNWIGFVIGLVAVVLLSL